MLQLISITMGFFRKLLVYNNTLLLGMVRDDSSVILQYVDCLNSVLIGENLVIGNAGGNSGPVFFSNAGEQSLLSYNKNGTW
ncbi:MAG TPA: hypothetical protein PK786_11965, partial [Treponemataceae bacterium]|nr:hypothetical protein [Treponemataceae bacterium]